MEYKVLKSGTAKDGRSFTVGAVVKLDEVYAAHLITRKIIKRVEVKRGKRTATASTQGKEKATK